MADEKFSLDLRPYEYQAMEFVRDEKGQIDEVEKTYTFYVRKELYALLRGNGVCKSGPEVIDAVTLARMIRDRQEDEIGLAKEDIELIRKILNVYISQEHNPAIGKFSLGGPRYEELIFRVFGN